MIEIRRSLRLSGYDLGLLDYELEVRGFSSDAQALTHRRLVLFLGDGRIWSLAGEDNHETLAAFLDARVGAEVRQRHYLWFRWEGRRLCLSGSDTETKADFERLQAWAESPERRHLLLRHMRDFRR